MLDKINLNEVKDVLHFNYKTEKNMFPRVCSSVSMTLALMMQNSNLKDIYDISYVRGHYKNEDEFEFESPYCDIEKITRFNMPENIECKNCTCDFMVGHSWIELTDKNNKVTILDFTSIQFDEDEGEYRNYFMDNRDLSKEDLYDYISKRCKFVITEEDLNFKNYISSSYEYSGEYLLTDTLSAIKEDEISILTTILNRIGYTLKDLG